MCLVTVDPQWNERLQRFGFVAWSQEDIVGQTFDDYVAPADRESWRQWLRSLMTPAAPSSPPSLPRGLLPDLDAPWRHLIAWPERGHPEIRLWLAWRGDVETELAKPWLRLVAGTAEPMNGAARRLLEADRNADPRLGVIGLDDAGMLSRWLGWQQPPASLQPVPSLHWQGQPVFRAVRDRGRDGGGMRRLTQIVRAGLHDLSNPLAALRMQVEVTNRSLEASYEASHPMRQAFADAANYVDRTIDVMGDLRGLLYASPSIEVFDLGQETRRIARLLRSEVDRRELRLDVQVSSSLPVRLEANRADVRLLVTTLLLTSLDDTDAGDILRVVVDSAEGARLRCRKELGDRPPTPHLVDVDRELLDALTAQCDARLRPSTEASSWCLEFPGLA